MKRLARAAAPAFLALAALLPLAGCTAPPTRPPTPSPHPRTQSQLREEAESKLTHSPTRALHWTGPVGRGVSLGKTEPRLASGVHYVLEAACAGSGDVDFYWDTVASGRDGNPEVLCDGGVNRFRFTGGDLIAFTFEPNDVQPPSGVLAWQILPS
jgi:hypothetical protein